MSVYINPAFADRPVGDDVRVYRLSTHGPELQLAPNFQLWEFACRCGRASEGATYTFRGVTYHDEVRVSHALVLLLQGIRWFFGAPTRVHRAYSTAWHNASIDNAVENSCHLRGQAADISVQGVQLADVASFARDALGAGGVGLYVGHVHVSVCREGGSTRSWGTVWATRYAPSDAEQVIEQLRPVAARLGVDLSGRSTAPSILDPGAVNLAGGGRALVVIAAGLAVTLALAHLLEQ